MSTSDATCDETSFPWRPPGQQRLDDPIPTHVDGVPDQPPTLPPSDGAEPHRNPTNILATEFLRAARPTPILAPKIGVARMSRRVLLLFSGAYTRPDGLVACLQRHDIEVVPVDNDPMLGDKSHDVLVDTFYSDLLRRAQRGEFLAAWAAPPCSTFSVARFRRMAGGPLVVRRRPPDQMAQALDCPPKNRSEVRKSNELDNRTINILRAAHGAGSEFGIESPADHGDTDQLDLFVDADHAPLWVVPEIIALKTDTECTTITFPQYSLGAPWRKDTTIMCTPALGFLLTDLGLLKCTHASHALRAVGIRKSDGSWNSKRAAAYPARLNAILAGAMAQLAAPVVTRATTSTPPSGATQPAPPPPPPPPPITLERPTPPQLPLKPIRPAPPRLPEPPTQPLTAATIETQPSAALTATPLDLISSRTRSKTRSVSAALAAMCLEDNAADGIILIAHSSTKPSAEPRSHAEAMRDDPRAGAPPNRVSSTTTATTRPPSSSTAPLPRAPTPNESVSVPLTWVYKRKRSGVLKARLCVYSRLLAEPRGGLRSSHMQYALSLRMLAALAALTTCTCGGGTLKPRTCRESSK